MIHEAQNQMKCILLNKRPHDISLARLRDHVYRTQWRFRFILKARNEDFLAEISCLIRLFHNASGLGSLWKSLRMTKYILRTSVRACVCACVHVYECSRACICMCRARACVRACVCGECEVVFWGDWAQVIQLKTIKPFRSEATLFQWSQCHTNKRTLRKKSNLT